VLKILQEESLSYDPALVTSLYYDRRTVPATSIFAAGQTDGVEAAKNSRINAELQYQSEVRRFDAGQSTNYFVLDCQNALSAARGRELRALVDFTKAVAELQRAMSTTLTSNNVEVK
jgi:outer membrane protein TolC